jgi:hypothetical protein
MSFSSLLYEHLSTHLIFLHLIARIVVGDYVNYEAPH